MSHATKRSARVFVFPLGAHVLWAADLAVRYRIERRRYEECQSMPSFKQYGLVPLDDLRAHILWADEADLEIDESIHIADERSQHSYREDLSP